MTVPTTKVYIAKYWETLGIFPLEGHIVTSGNFMAYLDGEYVRFLPSEFALSTNEAVEKAKALREAKLRALYKQARQLLEIDIRVTP